MKNKLMLSVFVLFSALYSIAQTNKVTVQGGVTGTGFLFSMMTDQKIKLGDIYHIGYEYETERSLLLSAGIEYSTMGSATKSEIVSIYGATTFENTVDFKYISIPLKVGKKIGDNWFGFGYLGVSNRFLVKATSEAPLLNSDYEQIGKHKSVVTQDAKRFDFAGIVDLGFGKRFSNHEVFLLGSFTMSATSFSTDNFFGGRKPRNFGGFLKIGYNYCF